MALHSSLPIYKVAYDLLTVATDVGRNMPRDFKVSIGGRIRDECVDMMVLIFDRARLANIVRYRGHSISRDLTQAFRRTP